MRKIPNQKHKKFKKRFITVKVWHQYEKIKTIKYNLSDNWEKLNEKNS